MVNHCSNGEINTRQRKAATFSKSLASSALFSRLALVIKRQLLGTAKGPQAATWGAPGLGARELLSSRGCLALLVVQAGSRLPAYSAEPQAALLKSFHAQFNSFHNGEGDLFQENPIQNDQGGLITQGKRQCYGPARQ